MTIIFSAKRVSTLVVICSIAANAYMNIPSHRVRRASWMTLHQNSPNVSPEEWDGGHPSLSSSDHDSSHTAQPISEQNPNSSFGARSPITAFSQSSYNGALDGVGGVIPLESISPSPQRLDRMKREADLKLKYLHGDQLIHLRQYMENLVKEMMELKLGNKVDDHFHSLSKALNDAREMDAEYMYQLSQDNALKAEQKGDLEEAKEWKRQATNARACLPQFNLEGLWVGKYVPF
jgi:hypothetical protein